MMVFEATNQILLLFVAVFLPLTGKSNLSVCLWFFINTLY